MSWEATAAIAAIASVLLTVALFVIAPIIQRRRREAPLVRISELKDNVFPIK